MAWFYHKSMEEVLNAWTRRHVRLTEYMCGSLCVGSWKTSYKTGPLLGLKMVSLSPKRHMAYSIDGPNLAFMIANLESVFKLEKNPESLS